MDLVDGRFQLEKLLGSGAFGEAHLAADQDGRRVVVKLLHAQHAANPSVMERFRREVVALDKLRHPNVVPIVAHGTCRARRAPYYAMEFSPGASLESIIEPDKTLPLPRALALVDQLLAALEAAHAAGIVHRDLKPANLLVESPREGEPERLRVIDFGLAKLTQGGEMTQADLTRGGLLGTPYYMAPEQWRGEATAPRTDIYAVGCILVRLLTGKVPFEAKDLKTLMRQHTGTPAPPLDERLPASPPALVEIVARCLEKGPERPDARTVRAALASIAADRTLPPSEPLETRTSARTLEQAEPAFSPHASLVGSSPTGAFLAERLDRTLPPSESLLERARQGAPRDRGLGPEKPRRTARLGSSREPLPGAGDALRGKLEVEHEGRRGVLFLFAGIQLRFGRNSNRGRTENDLVLRAFPRDQGEDPRAAEARTREISGHHGTFVLTRDGIAVRDESSGGTQLDGVALAKDALEPLKDRFVLEVAKVLALRGKVIRALEGVETESVAGLPPSHPVEALRLERTRDGEHMSYVLLVRQVAIGSGEDDAIFLPQEDVTARHARLAVHRGRFAVGPLAGRVTVRGREVTELVDLEPGDEIGVGGARLRYSVARDEDMKP